MNRIQVGVSTSDIKALGKQNPSRQAKPNKDANKKLNCSAANLQNKQAVTNQDKSMGMAVARCIPDNIAHGALQREACTRPPTHAEIKVQLRPPIT